MSEKSARDVSSDRAVGPLEVGDGQRVYWETCGNRGEPASCTAAWFGLLAMVPPPARSSPYLIILFDQRKGRSLPHG